MTNVNPTLYATNWSYLPYVSGVLRGPTATATMPPPTMTPGATSTNTPSPTATATIDPGATATNTPSPTATNEFQLPKPTLYDIDNEDGDGNFTVAWSAVNGANRYLLKENHNDTTWETIYDGPALSFDRSGLAPGNYCYNVRAFGPSGRSDWAGEKCTTVEEQPEPEFACEFEIIPQGPRSGIDIALLHDGRVFITQTSEDGASIFDPVTRSFEKVILPQGGGDYAAVLADGTVLLTVEGNDSFSMIYDPESGETTIMDKAISCLGVYGLGPNDSIMTYCGDNRGYYFVPYYDAVKNYQIERDNGAYRPYVMYTHSVRGDNRFMVTNGLIGEQVIDDEYFEEVYYAYNIFQYAGPLTLPEGPVSAMANNKSKIYFSGGVGYAGVGDLRGETVNEAYMANFDVFLPRTYTLSRIADLSSARAYHTMLESYQGDLIVLGGETGSLENSQYIRSIEIYVPAEDKWYEAGLINIGRRWNQYHNYGDHAIQLLNGEIFVYGGSTEPGPGYGYDAPTEIGRCERIGDN